ncbi:MAG: flagellar protein FlgN [Candidatus Neomarinimicrobiota bacterium]|nr:MAG: flagellar protein FlgN [Candidatus Neomarinimicrobiota bacterium]
MEDRFLMEDLFEPLVHSLEEELRVYGELVQVVQDKQEVIIAGDLDRLRHLVGEEQRLLAEAKAAEKHRKEAVRTIALARDLQEESPRLTDILPASPEPYRTHLQHLRQNIQSRLNRLFLVNQENELLINTSLNHIRGMVQLFLNVNEDAPALYTPQGTVDSKETANQMIDCRI